MRIMKKMISLQKAINRNKKALERIGLHLDLNQDGDTLTIGKIEFQPNNNPSSFFETPLNKGLLLPKISKELRKALQDKGISYFDYGVGNIFLNSGKFRVLLEATPKREPSFKKNKSQLSLNPTNLISPNGLAFIDTLFRLDNNVLGAFPSTLQFCKKFDLYQPKVSQIMKKLGAKNLMDFKVKLKSIPLEWWIYALETPAAKRKMTTFFDVAQSYYSLNDNFTLTSSSEILTDLNSKYKDDITPGPTEIAKAMGEIIDDEISLWISPSLQSKIKKELKLIPGVKEGKRRWFLASPNSDLIKEELVTHEPSSKSKYKTNLFRVVWDLSFGDSRLREARLNILRNIIK